MKNLFSNSVWSIDLSKDKKELIISNKFEVCYAFIDRKHKRLFFDRIICPKYIQKKALSIGMKCDELIDIYI